MKFKDYYLILSKQLTKSSFKSRFKKSRKSFLKQLKTISQASLLSLLVLPASTNYKLRGLQIGGSGGTLSSDTYQSEVIIGEQSGQQDSATYSANTGLIPYQESSVSYAVLSNIDESSQVDVLSDRLKLVIQPEESAADIQYLVAISDDGWQTQQYLELVGNDLVPDSSTHWYTYSEYNGSSGIYVINLSQRQEYCVRVKTRQGDYTESEYGPESCDETVLSKIVFDLDVSETDTENDGPYTQGSSTGLSLGPLSYSFVSDSKRKVYYDLSSNNSGGTVVEIMSQNGALQSISNPSDKIPSIASAGELQLNTDDGAYGVRNGNVVTVSVGTLSLNTTNYPTQDDYAGNVSNFWTEVANTGGGAVTGSTAFFLVSAVGGKLTPPHDDYFDRITVRVTVTY